MKAVDDIMHLYEHFIKVVYPKFSYSHHKNILLLPKLLYMSILQLLALNFGTVLELDKQNELKTSEVQENKIVIKLINKTTFSNNRASCSLDVS